MREPIWSRCERWLSGVCLAEAETDGVLFVIKSPMRERDSLLPARCSFFETREARPELRVCEFESEVMPNLLEAETLGVLLPMTLPMRELRLARSVLGLRFSVEREFAVPAWPPTAMPDCAAVGADGLVVSENPDRVLMEVFDLSDQLDCLPELLRVDIEGVLGPLLELDTDGVRVLIELPIREVNPELMRLLELLLRPLLELEVDGVLVVIEPPIREVRPELIRPLEFALPT